MTIAFCQGAVNDLEMRSIILKKNFKSDLTMGAVIQQIQTSLLKLLGQAIEGAQTNRPAFDCRL
jgi:hypothetical protein